MSSTSVERSLTLSVLDFPRRLEDSIALARRVEEYGYARFWLAEHAPQPNPILIASLVAAKTRTIRVGTAGILFHSYSPARAAYDFQLLEQQYPRRIDAGFCGGWFPASLVDAYLDGRSPGCKSDAEGYERRVRTLVHTLRAGCTPTGDEEGAAGPWPHGPSTCPQVWCMGTGLRSAELAARNGISFAYSLFHRASRATTEPLEAYRRQLPTGSDGPGTEPAVAAAVACAEDDARAQRVAEQSDLSAVIPTVVGDARRCIDELHLIAERYSTNEIVLLNLAGTAEERARSFASLIDARDR
ncbi:MAG TPA: LLM class flavin-dependent oxidoreductase [Thermoanaerobaculia bacterium]|nr:LLM class flavin-dependent oxidoreductase [Thermoanaerobaculia bacterium]